jgi:porin
VTPGVPWLTLQPDIQYIVNPSVDPELRDAFVIGVRFELSIAN